VFSAGHVMTTGKRRDGTVPLGNETPASQLAHPLIKGAMEAAREDELGEGRAREHPGPAIRQHLQGRTAEGEREIASGARIVTRLVREVGGMTAHRSHRAR